MTMVFVGLVLIEFFKAYNFRSDRRSVLIRPFANKWLNRAIAWELSLLVVVVYAPILQQPFATFSLPPMDWVIVLSGAASIVPVLELANGWYGAAGWGNDLNQIGAHPARATMTSHSNDIPPSGLATEEVEERLRLHGYNELPSSIRRGTFAIALSVAREPMFSLLIAASIIYLTLGDLREALILAASILVTMAITIFQERKTERALEALRDFSSPRALVIRDGAQKRIAGREVVVDDILLLTEGDRVPADAIVLSCNDLAVDESLLTGESVPVRKAAWDGKQEVARPGGDDLPFVFSGTMLVQGRGVARVPMRPARAPKSARSARRCKRWKPTRLSCKRNPPGRLIRNLAAVGLSLCALAVILYGLSRGNWLQGLLVGIALAMALLPEEIPVVLTVFLALGAWRMSQKRVLTRRMPAIEALGSATVLCVDKTGTLTLNRMSVGKLFAGGDFYEVDTTHDKTLPHEVSRAGAFLGSRQRDRSIRPDGKSFQGSR